MVEHNLGISMLSELILHGCTDKVRIVPITPTVARDLSIAVNPDRALTLPIKKLISLAKDYVKNCNF
jgi:DNA-binding transcriptional LysR family regulator